MPTQISPYVAVLCFSTFLSGLLTVIGVRLRDEIGADWFVVTMALVTVWNALGLAGFFTSEYLHLALFEMLMTILSISVPVVWFTFILDYSGRGDLLDRRTLVALWFVPVVAFASLLTFPFGNTLYFADLETVVLDGQVLIESPPGPLALLTAGYIYLLFAVGFWLLFRMIHEHENLYTGQALSLLVGTIMGAAVGLLKIASLVPDGVPIIPAGLVLLGVAYSYGLYRHRLLDLPPASRRIGSAEAMNDLDEGIIIVDRDWDVVAINESACEQFGCEKRDVLGDDVGAVSRDLRFEDPADQIVDLELDGRVFEVATSTVEDSRDRLAGYAIVIRDVTVQRGRKQHLEVLNRVLRHNLRNDMTVIKGYANEIASHGDDATAEMAASIDENADGLLRLAEKARDIEKTITTDEREEQSVELGQLIESVVDDLRESFPAPTVAVDVPDELSVRTDAATLELVVRNLVENALEHGAPEGSTDGGETAAPVERRTGSADAPDVEITARETNEGVAIRVSDDGPGIPSGELSVIERGTETALEHCSGLGLWLVDWGATRMGADLSYDTAEGTTVTLTLPAEDRRSGDAVDELHDNS